MIPKFKKIYLFLFILLTNQACTQALNKVAKLDDKLKEISGISILNDSVFVAHNDSGNDPILYFLNLSGEIIHQTLVSNARNVDWEDIATDGKGTIFIGDIGNNKNQRKNLKIYCVSSDSILNKKEVEASVIEISYEDQVEFPPVNEAMHFDAEALTFYKDSLLIFTKSQTRPFDGISKCYQFPAKPGKYELKLKQELQLKSRKLAFDAVTAVGIYNSKCYILTYSGIEIFAIQEKDPKKDFLEHIDRISFLKLTQKEALAVNKFYIYLADEHHKKLGGKNLYKIKMQ